MYRSLLVGLVALAACQPRVAVVRVTIPDLEGTEVPVPNLTVTFLPYDRDSIVAALEAAGPPRPHTRELDSLFDQFRVPYRALARLAATIERLGRLRDSLGSLPAPDPLRLSQADDSLKRLAAAQRVARSALEQARSTLGPQIDRRRAEVRQWDDSTLGDYGRIVRSLGDRVFANPVADTTSATGWALAEITKGRWWVTARTVDPADPNREWYWNVRVDPDSIYLSPQTGRNRPRY